MANLEPCDQPYVELDTKQFDVLLVRDRGTIAVYFPLRLDSHGKAHPTDDLLCSQPIARVEAQGRSADGY